MKFNTLLVEYEISSSQKKPISRYLALDKILMLKICAKRYPKKIIPFKYVI